MVPCQRPWAWLIPSFLWLADHPGKGAEERFAPLTGRANKSSLGLSFLICQLSEWTPSMVPRYGSWQHHPGTFRKHKFPGPALGLLSLDLQGGAQESVQECSPQGIWSHSQFGEPLD